MTTERLTDVEYWESGYVRQAPAEPLRIDSFRYLADRRIIECIESLGLAGKRVLEIGAGNSAALCFLARTHGDATFTGLDYSASGCRMLKERAAAEGARVRVVCDDMFAPDSSLLGSFDIVYSLGVVEHFTDLRAVLVANMRLLSPHGQMLTVIPNMAGVLGRFTKHYNRAIYELHNPHDLASLVAGHRAAGLLVESFGYLCSTNFGVLSSCFADSTSRGWTAYTWLARVSSLMWRLESRVGDLPHTALLSPYIFAVGRQVR